MSVKEKIKKVPFVYSMGRFVKERVVDAKAIRCLLAERRIQRTDGPIRVGFFCQYIPAWTKVADLYKAMQDDLRFEPILLCLPSGITNQKLDDPDSTENDAYHYCLENGYPEAINTRLGKENWLDLEGLNLHYIFYPRPYNTMVPPCYTTHRVSRYSRVCLIMYGVEFSEEMIHVSLNRGFMADTYYYFAELPFMREANIRRNRLGHSLNLQKTECHGYPMFARLLKFRDTSSASWGFSSSEFRVIWTPRWTTDPAVGGSNFFAYYEKLLDFAEKNGDYDFLFRPHPLALSHFVQTGEMTREQADAFRTRCAQLPNVCLDAASDYEATLWSASVMISDISSIMPEFFITGKPLIFCASNMELKLAAPTKRMLEGCYIINNDSELFDCLRMLRSGEDPMRELRMQIIEEQFGDSFHGVCDNILEALARDREANNRT